MIFEDPPDRVLQNADKIILFDSQRGGDQHVLYSNWKAEIAAPGSPIALIVSIPVDFRDLGDVHRWKERIAAIHPSDAGPAFSA
jgi:hypothetical protein